MRPFLTVGITTYNEADNISVLLDRLSLLDEECIAIILYDDASTDQTPSLISQHPLSKRAHVQVHLAQTNQGSPSIGRQYIADQGSSEYITFVDGDDLINPAALNKLVRRLPHGFDIILTPYVLGRLRQFPSQFDLSKPISSQTITNILSGIGGKIYNRTAVSLHAYDDTKGRSEDVRLNIRILLGGFDRIRLEEVDPFYFIRTSRKSTLARNILPHEICARVENYHILKSRYGLDDTYLKSLHRSLLKVVRNDASLTERERLDQYRAIYDIMPFKLKTIVHITEDTFASGSLCQPASDTQVTTSARKIRHVCLCPQRTRSPLGSMILRGTDNQTEILNLLKECHITDTVLIASDFSHYRLPLSVQRQLSQLPFFHTAVSPLNRSIQDRHSSPLEFSAEQYLTSIEEEARNIAREFSGKSTMHSLSQLHAMAGKERILTRAALSSKALAGYLALRLMHYHSGLKQTVLYWRITTPLRRLRRRLGRAG